MVSASGGDNVDNNVDDDLSCSVLVVVGVGVGAGVGGGGCDVEEVVE